MKSTLANARSLVTRVERGTREDKYIQVTGGRLFKYLGEVVNPETGEYVKTWRMRRHSDNGDNFTIVTREDVGTAMVDHGYTP
jgi:hypothetical protein